MLTYIIIAVLSFIAGALVFRNNKSKAEKIVTDANAGADKIKEYYDKYIQK